jgi:hypothetical protein
MKRDHIGFAILLCCLLLTPQVPLGGIPGLPGRTELSLGIVGLMIWGALSPRHWLRLKTASCWRPLLGLVLFAGYAFLVSLLSFSFVALAYAGQYLICLTLGYLLLSGYLTQAAARGELKTTGNILAAIGGVFSVGILVSVITGPFYPYEVQWAEKRWGGFYIQQGVGFAEGTNMAGAFLVVLCSYFSFAWPGNRKIGALLAMLSGLALFATISRGAIIGMAVGLGALAMLLLLRALLRQKMSRKSLRYGILLLLLILIIGFALQDLVSSNSRGITGAIALGFGIGGPNLLESESARRETWQAGWENWQEGNINDLVLGKGFRGSQTIHKYGTWQTAHNFFISVLGDFGMIGLVIFLGACALFLIPVGKDLLLRGGFPEERAAFVAGVGLLAHNMTETFFYSPALMGLLLLIFALPLAINSAAAAKMKF